MTVSRAGVSAVLALVLFSTVAHQIHASSNNGGRKRERNGTNRAFDVREGDSYPPYPYIQHPVTNEYNTSVTEQNIQFSDGLDEGYTTQGMVSDSSSVPSTETPQRYIVKFNSQEEFSAFQWNTYTTLGNTNGGTDDTTITTMHLPEQGASVLMMRPEQALQMQAQGHVKYVEPDAKRFLLGETTPAGLNLIKALSVSDSKISNRKVCIIDTGYEKSHPDLVSDSSIVRGESLISGEDWAQSGVDHGIHVAGIIAAIGGNGQGTMGVARSGKLKLHIVKIFNDSGMWTFASDLIQAVEKCYQAGANVVNMSLGGGIASNTESNMFQDYHVNRNMLFVAAAGNRGQARETYPASYNGVISVGAVDDNKVRAWFSNTSGNLELVAPGVNVYSTIRGGNYGNDLGTSMASAYVAGVAALVWSQVTTKSAVQVRNALASSAEDLGSSGRDSSYGFGLVRADRALTALGGSNSNPAPAPVPRPTPVAAPVPRPTPVAAPVPRPTPVAAPVPRPTPVAAPVPRPTPVAAPVPKPTRRPTRKPTRAPTRKPTRAPTRKPTKSPTRRPTNRTSCSDDPVGWHDADGIYFDCIWYSQNERCSRYGDEYPYLGKTANQACCACGGGKS